MYLCYRQGCSNSTFRCCLITDIDLYQLCVDSVLSAETICCKDCLLKYYAPAPRTGHATAQITPLLLATTMAIDAVICSIIYKLVLFIITRQSEQGNCFFYVQNVMMYRVRIICAFIFNNVVFLKNTESYNRLFFIRDLLRSFVIMKKPAQRYDLTH